MRMPRRRRQQESCLQAARRGALFRRSPVSAQPDAGWAFPGRRVPGEPGLLAGAAGRAQEQCRSS